MNSLIGHSASHQVSGENRMEQVRRLTKQAYSQAPWRSQTQIIVVFMLAVVAAALVAFIYLNTTAQAATIGRQIQEMQVN